MRSIRFVASCEEVRRLDESLAVDLGIPAVELMEIAGAGCFLLICGLAGTAQDLVVVAGPGQNGGDGLVIARYAAAAGVRVSVFATRAPAPGTASATHLERLARCGVRVLIDAFPALEKALMAPGVVVVDALFGTGVTQPLRPDAIRWIEAVNRTRGTIVSIDLPSGLDGDTGESPSGCVRAATTLTIGAIKPGLLTPRGADRAGKVEVVPLPYPPARSSSLKVLDS